MRRGKLYTGALMAGAIVLAGCQSAPQAAIDADPFTQERRDDAVIPIGPGGQIEVNGGDFFFEYVSGTAVDGAVSVTLNNVGGTLHNFRVDEAVGELKKVEAQPGESVTDDLLLFSGEYTVYCDIPGHRAAGMETTLTVYPNEEEAVPVGSGSSEGGGEQTDESVAEVTDDTSSEESASG